MSVNCPRCGQAVSNIYPEEEYFCWKCGAKFTSSGEVTKVIFDEKEETRKRRERLDEKKRGR